MAALKGHGFNRAAKVTRFLEINPRDEVAYENYCLPPCRGDVIIAQGETLGIHTEYDVQPRRGETKHTPSQPTPGAPPSPRPCFCG